MISRKKIVIFTGAGISQSAGLSTFRDLNGYWNNFKIDEVATIRAFSKDKKKVLNFYNERRKEIEKAEATKFHLFCKNLEEYFDVTIVTQNIDNLHEKAGSTKVLHLHGNIFEAKVKYYNSPTIPYFFDIECGKEFIEFQNKKIKLIRHNIVLFGEQIQNASKAKKAFEQADILIVAGTSLEVEPAASMALKSKAMFKFLIDKNIKDKNLKNFNFVIEKESDYSIEDLNKILDNI